MWFPEIDPNMFGAYYGALVGGVGGTLCGLLGAAAGTLAHRGVGRRWVMGAMWLLELFGLSQLVFGIAALVYGQPYGIWYAPLLTGVVLSGLFAALIPVMRRVYAEAERRKMDAEGLRRGL